MTKGKDDDEHDTDDEHDKGWWWWCVRKTMMKRMIWCNDNDVHDDQGKGDDDDDVVFNNDDFDEQVRGGGPVDWPPGVTEGNAGGTTSGIIDLIKETVSQVRNGNPLFSRQMNSTVYRTQLNIYCQTP